MKELLAITKALSDSSRTRAVMALSGGEDYELLFTAPGEIMERVSTSLASPVTVIGEVVTGKAGEVSLFDAGGNAVALPHAGWEHFNSLTTAEGNVNGRNTADND